MEQFASIVDDTICVGQRRPHEEDERVLLFVKMRSGHKLTRDLEQQMRDAIKQALSPRHVPKYILEIEDIPVKLSRLFALLTLAADNEALLRDVHIDSIR